MDSNKLGSTIIEFDILKQTFKEVRTDDLLIDMQDKNKIYWIHCNLSEKQIFKQLATKLRLPEEVVYMCNQEDIMPQVREHDEALTVHIESLVTTEFKSTNEACFSKLIMHLTTRYCFTAANDTLPALKEFMQSYQKAIRYAKTPCFIFFLIFDNVINDYTKILFEFELLTDQMDVRVRSAHHNIYNDVMDIKQEVMKVKRNTIAARDILMRLSGRTFSVISEQCRTSLYNLSNNSHMVVHEADSLRDVLNGLLDQIDNSLMQKMNESMKVLTAVAAIFLPLTLITGIYGMNFRWMPELQWQYGYFFALGLIVLCGAGMLLLFKRMKWF